MAAQICTSSPPCQLWRKTRNEAKALLYGWRKRSHVLLWRAMCAGRYKFDREAGWLAGWLATSLRTRHNLPFPQFHPSFYTTPPFFIPLSLSSLIRDTCPPTQQCTTSIPANNAAPDPSSRNSPPFLPSFHPCILPSPLQHNYQQEKSLFQRISKGHHPCTLLLFREVRRIILFVLASAGFPFSYLWATNFF
ncbi:unnamed protein product [Periconia digitata]|uniref:Uncharacterized protein n=1 Tax=Periconia digitata TaxID=1303443 RepID=A0A9W4XRV5_9PLEO|nr:unnamed protein product [Periconia digitata]